MSTKKSGWKTILTVITILALTVLVYAVRRQLVDTLQNLQNVELYWVLLVVPLEALNHLSQAKLYQGLFRVLGDRFRTRPLFRLSLELNFVNTVFPSGGVSGFSYLSLRLQDEKVSTGKATLVQLMRFVLIFISFQILLFIGLVFLAVGGRANDFLLLIAGSLATLVFIVTMLLAFVIGSKSRIDTFFTFATKTLNRIINIVRRSHPETISVQRVRNMFHELHENYMHIRRNMKVLKKPLVFALLASLTEITALYSVYVAFGQWVNPGAVILAFAVANFAGLISVLPGGVGIYEALMTGVLVAGGVPASISLPVTVMFRVVNMSVQLPPGYFFYHRALHAKPLRHEYE